MDFASGQSAVAGFSSTNNYYTFLNISPTSTKQELIKIKRNLGLQHHPDRQVSSGGASPEAVARFQRMMEVIDALLDDNKRLEHDTRCGINMDMRINNILARGDRLAKGGGANSGEWAPSGPTAVCESDDDEYDPSVAAPTHDPQSEETTEENMVTTAQAGQSSNVPALSGLFGSRQHTHEDIIALGFKPKAIIPSKIPHYEEESFGDESVQKVFKGGLGQGSAPELPPLHTIGLHSDISDRVKAFESVGLKRERSPILRPRNAGSDCRVGVLDIEFDD